MIEIIFTVLTTLGGGVIAYLIKENNDLKTEIKELQKREKDLAMSILKLTTAIEYTNTVHESTDLHKVAKEISKQISLKYSKEGEHQQSYHTF